MKATPFLVIAAAALVASCGGSANGEIVDTDLAVEMNEALAVSHLRSLVGAQTHAQSLGVVDADEDGVGEFLFLGELAGTERLRAGGAGRKMPLMPPQICQVSSTGYLEMHGYLFRVHLPAESGNTVGEGPGEGGVVNPDGAEEEWFAYAWPLQHGRTGIRTFVVTADGAIAACDVPVNSGASAPKPYSAFEATPGGDVAVAGDWAKVD
ncbi:MAG: hypothetical protein ABFS86_11175 [Planctomycetota bacterium]